MWRRFLAHYRSSFADIPRPIWILALVLLVNRAGTMVLPFLAIYLTSHQGMSPAGAGKMIGLYGLGSIVGAFSGGMLVDRCGALRLQAWCLFLASGVILLIPLCSHWAALGAALFCLSAVSDAVRPANATAITRMTDTATRPRAFALQRLAANLGLSIGPAVGGLFALVDFNLLFAVDSLSTLLSAVLLIATLGVRRLPSEGGIDRSSVPPVSPLRDGPFVGFLLLMLVSVVVFVQLLSTYPLYLRDHYLFNEAGIGGMFAVNTLIIVVVEMMLISAIKQWNLTRTIGWGCFLLCVGYGLLPLGTSVWLPLASMAIVTMGEMLAFPLATTLVSTRSPTGQEGRYLGWYMTMFSTATVLGPLAGAWIYTRDPDAVWLVAIAVGCLVLPAFYCLSALWGNDESTQVEESPHAGGQDVEADFLALGPAPPRESHHASSTANSANSINEARSPLTIPEM